MAKFTVKGPYTKYHHPFGVTTGSTDTTYIFNDDDNTIAAVGVHSNGAISLIWNSTSLDHFPSYGAAMVAAMRVLTEQLRVEYCEACRKQHIPDHHRGS